MSLHFESAVDVAASVRTGEYDPVEVVDAFLERIDERNDVTNAYVTVLEEDARDKARAVRERLESEAAGSGGEDLPLAGVPVAVKDLSETMAGVRHTMGLKPLADNVAEETSVTVRRLEEAGAVVVGTTNTPELGHTPRTKNLLQGPTGTPFDPELNAGGSSGGSAAALADGLCALATGSDVGGSLRNPASCCGVASVKPTFGLVPRANRTNGFRGHTPFGVLGPMARDVEGLALMLDVMAGEDRIDPFSLPKQANYREAAADPPDASELSVAYSPDLDVFAVEPEVREAVGSTLDDLESAGATVEAVTFETPEKGELTHAYSLAVTTFFATTAAEIRESLGVDITAMDTDEVPADLQTLISMGQSHDIAEYVEADFPRTDLYHAVEDALDGYDALACPTLATLPLTHEEPFPQRIDGEPTGGMPTSWMLAWPFNMTGHPVVNVPAEPVDGLPVGMQLVGGTFSEPRLLGVARAVEETSPWGSPGE